MLKEGSRYRGLVHRVEERQDGRMVVYQERRILPQGARMPVQTQAQVHQGERLDLFTHRTLGRSELFWRIADANDALDPFDLVAVPGRTLAVPIPTVEGPRPSLEK